MMRSVIVCSLLAALSSTATAFLPAPPLTLSGRGLATGVATRSPAVAVRRGHAAELRCTATRLDVPTLSPLLEASDLNEFTATLQRSKVVFVKLYQGRCRQCIALAPKFKSLAVEHSRLGEVVFMKVPPASLPTPLRSSAPACSAPSGLVKEPKIGAHNWSNRFQVAADRLREIAKHAGITRAPTIQAYVDGVLYGQIVRPLLTALSLLKAVGESSATEVGCGMILVPKVVARTDAQELRRKEAMAGRTRRHR